MTEQEARSRFVSVALSYAGMQKGTALHHYLIDQYNKIRPLPRAYEVKYTDDYCAAFVSSCAYQAGMTSIIFAECGCEEMIKLYQRAGRWHEEDDYRPKFGDLFFYDWQDSGAGDDTGWSDHVAVVTAVDDNGFDTVEGNTGGGQVLQRRRSHDERYARGFAAPDYSAFAAACNAANKDQPSDYATKAIAWAKANGISDGKDPKAYATREQVITMLYRYHMKFKEE